MRRVCHAASKYKGVCLNDKLLAEPDLLHGLNGTIFRFREKPVALTADIESMFLQVQVPEQDRSCLRFLWRPRTNEPVQIYEYQRHVFGARSSPTCANYALKRVGLDNEEVYPTASKAIQNNFYMDGRNHAVNVSAATINQSNEVNSFLQIVPVSIQSDSNRLNKYAFPDSGSTVSFVDRSVNEKLRAKGTDVTLNIAGIHGTKNLKTEMVSIKLNGLLSKVHSIKAFVHTSI